MWHSPVKFTCQKFSSANKNCHQSHTYVSQQRPAEDTLRNWHILVSKRHSMNEKKFNFSISKFFSKWSLCVVVRATATIWASVAALRSVVVTAVGSLSDTTVGISTKSSTTTSTLLSLSVIHGMPPPPWPCSAALTPLEL